MHPGQYTILNTPDNRVLSNSIRELQYHADVLDALGLDASAKIQIHVGGAYGNKDGSIRRFIERYYGLSEAIRRILVIENNFSGVSIRDALADVAKTWQVYDGIPMVDYSGRRIGGLKVGHMESIDAFHFKRFLSATQSFDFDLMLEIKDKEMSALKAVELARKGKRFFSGR